MTDPLDRVTSYVYNDNGWLTDITLPDPDDAGPLAAPEITRAYDNLGRLTTLTDPLGNVTTYEYDINGLLVKQTDPDPDGAGSLTSPITEWDYDDAARLTSMTDPLGQVTTYAYDDLGRQTSVTLPDPDAAGSQTAAVYTTTYDSGGNVLTETDPLSKVTEYEYDDLHRLVSVTDPELGETVYAYDAAGDLVSLTDPVGNVTTWTYDDLGRITAETNDLSDTRSWTYDAAGNVLTATDRLGRVSEFSYDNLQRLTQELWKQSSTTVNTVDYTYDAASQLTSIADDFSAYAYTYDDLGRVVEIDNAGTSVGPTVVLIATYDAAGRRTTNRAEVDGTGDFINTYAWDNLGRLTSVKQAAHQGGNSVADKRVDFAYNEAGQFDEITRYAAITQTDLVATTSFTYDDAHRLIGLSHDQDATTLADYAWTYDTAGRLTSATSVDGTDAYTYDDTGQLTGVDSDYQTDEAYTYDANGNRTNTGYSTGDNNRLLSDGTYNYEYDDEGNRTKKTEISTGDYVEYTWDHRNRLTSVTFRTSGGVKTKEVQYSYDVFDRRISKSVDADGNGTFDSGETYVYDGSDIALVYDASDNLIERLMYGPAVDQPLASEDATGDVLWLLADNQGTIRDVAEYDSGTDTTSVVNHITYGGFGNITSQTNATYEPRHTYTGREWDADAELFYYRARWYDPTVGRFLSEDPIGFAAGDANLSRYVGNAPTNSIDPDGLEARDSGYRWWNPFTWFNPWFHDTVPDYDHPDWQAARRFERRILDSVNREYGTNYTRIDQVPKDKLKAMGAPPELLDELESPQTAFEEELGNAQVCLGAAEGAAQAADAAATAAEVAAGIGAKSAIQQGLREGAETVAERNAAKALTQAQESALRKIKNIEKGHLKPGDFTGTLRDMMGNPVPKPGGGYWDHAQEMNNSLRGLRKHAKTLEGASDPAAIKARNRALELIKNIEDHIRGAGI